MWGNLSTALKVNWLIWILLTLLVIYGTIGLNRFFTPSIAVTLIKGNTYEVTLNRPTDDKLSMTLGHQRIKRDNEKYGKASFDNGKMDYDDPLPIKIVASNGQEEQIYQALDVYGLGAGRLWRGLKPVKQKNGQIYVTDELPIYKGDTKVTLSVADVSPELEGEEVEIGFKNPVSFKVWPSSNYKKFWWWFLFSFYYTVILFVYFLILVIWSWFSIRKSSLKQSDLAK